MVKKKSDRIKKLNLSELDLDERELFLDAFYQNESLALKKHEKRVAVPAGEDEHALFLRAVNQAHMPLTSKKEDYDGKTATKRAAQKRSYVDAELDLHGMFVDEAISLLFRFVDREYRHGSKTLLIVHGKGAGVLRKAVRSCLCAHPKVSDCFQAQPKMGGSGAIVVRLTRASL